MFDTTAKGPAVYCPECGQAFVPPGHDRWDIDQGWWGRCRYDPEAFEAATGEWRRERDRRWIEEARARRAAFLAERPEWRWLHEQGLEAEGDSDTLS